MTRPRTNHRTSKTPKLTGGDDRPSPACNPETAHLFSSTDLADHEAAKQICETCPIVEVCIRKAVTIAEEQSAVNVRYRGPDGTWGGLLWKDGQILDPDNMPRIHKRKNAA